MTHTTHVLIESAKVLQARGDDGLALLSAGLENLDARNTVLELKLAAAEAKLAAVTAALR